MSDFEFSMINASISLIELLQREVRHPHTRQLPDIYKIIARTYSRGIHTPLELVLTTLNTMATMDRTATTEWLVAPKDSHVRMAPIVIVIDVLERMLCDTYALCAYTYERASEGRVRRACVEWLGELARQQLATLQYCRSLGTPHSLYYEECEAWRSTAAHWYGMAARDVPDDGRWYAALGELCERDVLLSMYYYCKSLQVVHPRLETREIMLELVHRKVQQTRVAIRSPAHDLFAHLLGLLLMRVELDTFEGVLNRLAHHLTQDPCPLLETEWCMISVCTAAAILEFGREDAWVPARHLGAFHIPSDARPLSDSCATLLPDLYKQIQLATQTHVSQPRDVASILAACDNYNMPMPLSCALALAITLVDMATRRLSLALNDPAAHINAPGMFLTVMLSFLYVLTLRTDEPHISAVCEVLRDRLAWSQLASYACGDVFGSRPTDEAALLPPAQADLPEDWCLRGILWNVCTPKTSPVLSQTERMHAFSFVSESNMLADLGAISRHFATLTTNTYRAAYAQDPELKRLLQVRHARTSLLTARLYGYTFQHKRDPHDSGSSLSEA